MLYAGLAIGILFCGTLAVIARQLLQAVLWLACTSVLVAVFLFQLGAHEIAVIELSVGAGLVTILIVFTLNMIGESPPERYSLRYHLFSIGIVIVLLVLLSTLIYPTTLVKAPSEDIPFSNVVWDQRGLDTLLQVLLIFCGALTILSLITVQTRQMRHYRPTVIYNKLEQHSPDPQQKEANDVSIHV